MIRKVTHFLLAWIGTVFWAIGNCFYVLTALMILLGQKVHPTSKYGNCWSYAVPLWLRYGGHLAVRASDHNKFLWVFPLPHVKFIPVLPPEGVEMRQFIPQSLSARSLKPSPGTLSTTRGRFMTRRPHTTPCQDGRRTLVLSMILPISRDVSSYVARPANLCAVCT